MKNRFFALLGLLGLVVCGCRNGNGNDEVVSQRYVHKYGYAISQEDWESKTYPGQEVTTLRNGVTMTTTYENGIQHGPTTHTFPHSQTVEHYYLYNLGNKVKEISYDPAGIPVQEWVQLSPTRYSITLWYKQGSPRCVEEFVGNELLAGQYFTIRNELASRVERGSGLRSEYTREGVLVAKEVFEEGYAIKKETFYPTGSPESIAYYLRGALHGEKRVFAETGEPLAIEEWVNDQLHGKSTLFKNGNRYLEVTYLFGQKNGIERQFVDGDVIAQEIPWENGLKHGEAVYYSKGKTDNEWYYEDKRVSRSKFDELNKLDVIISRLPYSTDAQQKR
jgi:antitoxin component YwqK of YwqJK toxin-antitoxin module